MVIFWVVLRANKLTLLYKLHTDYFSLCQSVILSVLSHEEIYLNICRNVRGVFIFVILCICPNSSVSVACSIKWFPKNHSSHLLMYLNRSLQFGCHYVIYTLFYPKLFTNGLNMVFSTTSVNGKVCLWRENILTLQQSNSLLKGHWKSTGTRKEITLLISFKKAQL